MATSDLPGLVGRVLQGQNHVISQEVFMDAEIPGKPPIVPAGNKPAAASISSFIGAECLPKESSEQARDAWTLNFTFLLTGVSEQNDLSALYRAAVSGVTLTALSKFAQSVDMLSSDSIDRPIWANHSVPAQDPS